MCTTHREVTNVYKGYGKTNRPPAVAPCYMTEHYLTQSSELNSRMSDHTHIRRVRNDRTFCFTRLTSPVFPLICNSSSPPHFKLSPQFYMISVIQSCIETRRAVSDTETKKPSRYALHKYLCLEKGDSSFLGQTDALYQTTWRHVAGGCELKSDIRLNQLIQLFIR